MKDDFRLKPGQRRPHAEMGAGAERDVLVLRPAHVEAVGVGELRRIAVGGCQQQVDPLPPADLGAVHLQIDLGQARRQLNRAVVAQDLLDRRGHQRRIVPDPPHLVGVAQQGQQAVADQVRGRLVAGDE